MGQRHVTFGKFIACGSCVLLLLLVYRSAADPILDPLRDLLVNAVTRFVSKSLNGTLQIEALRGSLLGSPVLHHVVLRDVQGTVIARIEEIRLTYNLTSLIKKRLIVHTVDIVRPQLTLIQEADGTLNLSRLAPPAQPDEPVSPEPPSSGLPFALVLERVQLHDGQLTLQIPSLPEIQRVEGLEVDLQSQLDAQGLQVTIKQVTARTMPADITLHTLRGSLQQEAGTMRLDDLRLGLGKSHLTAAGVLPGSAQPASLAVQVQPLDLDEIGHLLHHPALHGLLHLTLHAEGPPEALVVRAQLQSAGGQVNLQSQLNTVAVPLQYRGDIRVANFDLATMIGRAALQSDINLRLQVDGAGQAPENLRGHVQLDLQPSHVGNIVLHSSQVDVAMQPNRFQVERFALDTSVAQMTATGAIDLTGSSDLQYQLQADVAHMQQLLGTEALGGTWQLRGQARGKLTEVRVDGTLRAENLRYQENRLQTLVLTYGGTPLADFPHMTAQLEVRQAQAGTFPVAQMALQATYEGRAQQVRFDARVQQSSTSGGQASGMLTLSDTGQQLRINDLLVQLDDQTWRSAAPLEVIHEGERVDVRQFRLAHADASLTLSGAIDGQRLQALRLDASRIDLTHLQRLLQLPDMVGGHATLHAQLNGSFAEPRLQGELAMHPETPPQVPDTHLLATLGYANRQLQSDLHLRQADREVLAFNLRLPVDMALGNLTLAQRLLEGPVAGTLQLVRPDLAALHRWQPTLPDLAGTLQGQLTLQGTYAALALNADLQFQELGVVGVAEQISAPVNLTASMATAASASALAQALSQGQFFPHLERLQLRVPTLSAQLPGQGSPPQPVQIHNLLLQAAAQLQAAGWQAKLDTLQLQADAFGLPRAELALTARMTPAQLDVQSVQIRLAQSELRGRGTMTIPGQALQMHVDIPRLRLDELVPTFPATLPPDVQGSLDLKGSVPAPELTTRWQYAGAEITTDTGAQLQTEPPRYSTTMRIKTLDVAQLLPSARGHLQALVTLQGSGFDASERHAQLDVQVDASDFTLAPGLSARLHALLDGNAVQLPELRVDSGPAAFMAQGTLSATQQVALTYTLTLGDLQPLRDHLQIPLQAEGGLSGELQGSLEALQTHASLQLRKIAYTDFQGESLQADLAARNLPSAPQATLTAHLAALQSPSLPASSLRLEVNYAQPQGTFTATVTEGPYAQTGFAGEVSLQDGMRVMLERLRLQLRDLIWENGEPIVARQDTRGIWHLERLLLRSEDQEISARGTLTPAGAVDAEVRVQQLHIQPTVRALAPEATLPDGQLALNLMLRGTLAQPQLDGVLQLTSLQWQENRLGDIHAQLGLMGKTARTDLRWQQQEQDILRVHGTAGLEPDGAIALQIQAPDFDLAKLMPFSSQVRHSAGQLKLDLQIQGTLQQPQAQGALELRDGELQLAATGERYQDMQVRLLFGGNRVDIGQCHVGSRSGTMQLTGWLTFAGLTLDQIEASLQAQNFTAMYTPTIEARLSGDVGILGSMQDLLVIGEIHVPRARVRMEGVLGGGPAAVEPWQLTVPGVYGAGPEAVQGTNGEKSPPLVQHPLPFLRADVSVDMPRNVWIQGSGTAVELAGELQVKKALEGPFLLDGSIETIRGFASYFGKKFILQEGGTVTFTGAEEINPILDVTALHEVSDYEVTIRVEGKAKEPKLTFSSVPELPQADIISLLVVGKTTDRLTNSEQSSLSKQTRAIAGSMVARQAEQLLGKSLGLDTIEVDAGDSSGGGSVSVGRYVTQDLFLSYGREFQEKGKQSGNKVGVEYSFDRRLKLKGTSSDLGETALDLLWRLEY